MIRLKAAMQGATTLEVIVALILFALAMAGLAIVIPMAYERSSLWQDQLNLASYLEQRLEANRVYTFEQLPFGDTGNLLDGNFIYRINTIYVVPGTDGGNPSWVLSNSTTGDGLWATYYDRTSGTISSRLDSQINYNWGVNSPIPGTIGTDNFQVVWLGHVEAPVSGTYTFYAWVDDAVRLWVNNTLVIDYWQSGTAGERSGTIALTAGTRYPIKMEFYEYQTNARAELRWASLPALAYGLVPQNRLYSSTAKRATITTAFNKSGSISLSGQLLALQVWSGTIFNTSPPPPGTNTVHFSSMSVSLARVGASNNVRVTYSFTTARSDGTTNPYTTVPTYRITWALASNPGTILGSTTGSADTNGAVSGAIWNIGNPGVPVGTSLRFDITITNTPVSNTGISYTYDSTADTPQYIDVARP